MYYTGFADEAAFDIDGQIAATRQLGWSHIETRNVGGVNIHDLPEAEFDRVAARLEESGVRVNCFGSAVANWANDPFLEADFAKSQEQLARALPRMRRLGCSMLRGMSFRGTWDRPAFDAEVERAVFPKVRELARRCEDAGVLYLHENCNNYGGMSWQHTLRLLEYVDLPNFRLVFDTGNCSANYDRSEGSAPGQIQSSWEFYAHVKEFIHYVHIKDARFVGAGENGFNRATFHFPGEGDSEVARIVADLLRNGYDGGFSIEPHMAKVAHALDQESSATEAFANYLEYGRRFMALVEQCRKTL